MADVSVELSALDRAGWTRRRRSTAAGRGEDEISRLDLGEARRLHACLDGRGESLMIWVQREELRPTGP
eukprot:11218648-Heterocapsa_arctica.AAC.1